MAYQAPTQSFGPPSRLGGAIGEDRIRRLMEERRRAGLDFDPMAELAVTPAQSIVAQEQANPEQPTAADIVAAEEAGLPKASLQFDASRPEFPVTEAERQAPVRASQNARRLVEAQGPSGPASPARRAAPRQMSPSEMRAADRESMPDLPPNPKPMSVRGPAPAGASPEPIALGPAQGAGHAVRNEAKEQELMARYNAAVEDGDAAMAQKALSELEAERRKFSSPGQEPETEDIVSMSFGRLSPEQQDALSSHFGGMAPNSMDMAYGDLPFNKIADAMAADANRLIANANPQMGVGELRGTFAPRGANTARPVGDTTGIPTTRRRLPTQGGQSYPAVTGPNGEGYGTFEDVGGSLRLAAPQTSLIDLASQHSSTPPNVADMDGAEMRAWEDAMMQAAVASGLDVQRFRNRGEIVRAGQEMLRRHEQLTKPDEAKGFPEGRYEVQYNPTGRSTYAPTSAMRKNAEDAGLRAHANEFVRNFQPAEEFGLAIREAAERGDAGAVRALMQRARNERAAATAAATREMGAMRGRTQNMNNPAVAPAMFEQSIMNAESPEQMGQVMLGWGGVSPQAGRVGAAMVSQASAERAAAEAEQRSIDAELRKAEIIASSKDGENALAMMAAEINSALANSPNPTTALHRIKMTKNAAKANGLLPASTDVEYESLAEVSAHTIGQTGQPDNPVTIAALNRLYAKMFTVGTAVGSAFGGRDREDAFAERASLDLGVSREFASQWLRSKGAPAGNDPKARAAAPPVSAPAAPAQ